MIDQPTLALGLPAPEPTREVPVRAHTRTLPGAPDLSPHPRWRNTDLPTSRAAARRVDRGLPARILALYTEHGPLTPFEVAGLLPDALDGTVRAAVGRLRRGGVLVVTGVCRPSPSGCASAELRLSSLSTESKP